MSLRGKLNLVLSALVLLLTPSLASGVQPLLIAVASDGQQATSFVSNFALCMRVRYVVRLPEPARYDSIQL
jgi:hypothetical protein